MMHTLLGVALCAVLVVFFVLSYRHKEGSCTGTGDCGACHGTGHCSTAESDHE